MGVILFFIFVVPMILGIIGSIFGGNGSSSTSYYSDFGSDNNYSEDNNNSWDWQPHVDSDDRDYDSFGSYGSEDDLADWDENDDC